MIDTTILCHALGHSVEGDPLNVTDITTGETVYRMRECKRCGYRVPVSEEDAQKKAVIVERNSAIMNGARAQYELPPISWDI